MLPELAAAGLSIASDLVDAGDPEDVWGRFVAAARGGPTTEVLQRARSFDNRLPERVRKRFQAARAQQGRRLAPVYRQHRTAQARYSANAGRVSWRHIPQVAWKRAHEHTAIGPIHGGQRLTRRIFTSISLARWVSPELTSHRAAVSALGLHAAKRKTHPLTRELREAGLNDEYTARLQDVKDWLEGIEDPIDYATRRSAFADLTEIADGEWDWIRSGNPPRSKEVVHRYATTAWLWATMTGGDWRIAPASRRLSLTKKERVYLANEYLPSAENKIEALAVRYLAERDLPGPLGYDYTILAPAHDPIGQATLRGAVGGGAPAWTHEGAHGAADPAGD